MIKLMISTSAPNQSLTIAPSRASAPIHQEGRQAGKDNCLEIYSGDRIGPLSWVGRVFVGPSLKVDDF